MENNLHKKKPNKVSRRVFFKRTGGAGLVAVAGITAFSQKNAYATSDGVGDD